MALSISRFAFAALAALALSLGSFATPASAQLRTIGPESKYAAIVVDANSGEVLYARNADSLRYPASITKVMTLYLAFEAMAAGKMSPTDDIVVSKHAASMQPTKLGLRAGATISVDNALRAISVQSANDMAVAMAEKIGGTESRFAALMTLRAQELGMQNTRFVNASGLPDSRQVSSARDIALMSRAMMRDFPQYYSYLSQKQFVFNGASRINHNRLLGAVDGVDGLKTGFINSSGYNLAASAMRDGNRLITVVMGGNTTASRDAHVTELLNIGFDIMRRRAGGEKIVVAQSLFELPSAPPAFAPSLAQGDAGVPGELTSSTAAGRLTLAANPGVIQVAMAPIPNPEPSVQATPAQEPERTPKGRYMVQVGAFKAKTDARSHLSQISKRFSQHFDMDDADVGSAVGGFFRARFTGFTADTALAACKAMKSKKLSCLVVAP